MFHYQLFYEATVKLLQLQSPVKVKYLLQNTQEFSSWFKLQSFAVVQPDDFKNLHRDLYEFFYKTCPKLRIFES
jgi:hypothetical protein